MKTLQFLFKTDNNAAPLIARLMLGIVMFQRCGKLPLEIGVDFVQSVHCPVPG
ncbi:MAG: hypothetical protein ACI8UO_003380, partial [Verrucomicrobiales bacterium]